VISVAHIVAHPPFREGTGTVCYYNAQALRQHGCAVEIFVPGRPGLKPAAEPNGYRVLPTWLALENAFLNPALLTTGRFDLLHLHLPFIWGGELVGLRSLASRVPLVITYHNDLIGFGYRRPLFYLYNLLITPFLLRLARRIVVVSHDHAAGSHFGPTIFRQRARALTEIANGVDVDHFHPQRNGEPVRAQLGVQREECVVLFVSSLDRAHIIKGLYPLIDAVAQSADLPLRLVVVGDGEDRAAYEQYAAQRGLAGRASFVGRVDHQTMPAYYAAADLVAIPARAESFGLALAEGMASGKPVIGSNSAGARALIHHGTMGYLVNSGDHEALVGALHRLAADPALRQSMGARGREHIVAHYSWARAGERLLALYREVLYG
jgi:glycosyltransferase involved in cell wall biosynthesis